MSPLVLKFEQFLKEKRYIAGLSNHTIRSYKFAFDKYQAFGFDNKKFVIGMRKAGLSPVSINIYIRSINSFLSWSHAEPIKQVKVRPRAIKCFTDREVRLIVSYRPKGKTEMRIHRILLFLLDTGVRIEEALGLVAGKLDFDNLLVTVIGKGNKERVIPFSLELRKVLYKHVPKLDNELVFCNRHGGKLSYNNLRRDFNNLMDKLGIKTDGTFHNCRRFFATNFIRQNGNPLILQRLLGHSSLAMTTVYIKLVTEDLSQAHAKTSVLGLYR
jgi:integrase/recombinase XerD